MEQRTGSGEVATSSELVRPTSRPERRAERRPPQSAQEPVTPAEQPAGDSDSSFFLRRPRDWAWRRRLRARPATYQAYRLAVGALGVSVVVIGLILVPLPGPGWLIVFFGLAILASEFHSARRLHQFASRVLRRWNDWLMASPLSVRLALTAGTLLGLVACGWLVLKVLGIPGFVPEWITQFLRAYAAL